MTRAYTVGSPEGGNLWDSRLGTALIALSVSGAYYLGTVVGLRTAFPASGPSILWPPNAILLAVLLLTPPRRWGVYLLAAFPAHFLIEYEAGFPLPLNVGLFITNCGQALLGTLAVRWTTGSRIDFDELRHVIFFIAGAAIVAPFVISFVDVGLWVATGWPAGIRYWPAWWVRFASNALTVLVVTPALVIGVSKGGTWLRKPPRLDRAVEAALLIVGLAAVETVIGLIEPRRVHVLMYAPLPLLLWAAVRFGSAGVSTSLLAMTLCMTLGAVRDPGSFAGSPEAVQAFSAQFFMVMVVTAVSLMFLAAVVRERERAEAALQSGRAELEDQLRFERLGTDMSTMLMGAPAEDLGKQIVPALGHVATLLGFDVATLAVFTGKDAGLLAYVWHEPGTPGLPANLTEKDFPWLARELFAGRDVAIRTLDDFPPEGQTDRATYERYGIRSSLDAPVFVSGEPVGVLTMGSFRKELSVGPHLVERLRVLGAVFGNALVRARSEIALRESERRLALAAAAGDLGLWLWNLRSNSVWVTERAREMFGFERESELTYDLFYARVHPEDRPAVDAGIAGALAGKSNYEAEYRICLPDGAEKWIVARGEVSFEPGGQPVSMSGIVSDITARRRDAMELFRHRQELTHTARMSVLGELAASLAHELNQPLTAILSNSQAGARFLAGAAPRIAEVRDVLEDIGQETKRAGEVIRQMRKLVKKSDLQFERLDLNQVIGGVVRLVHGDTVIRKVQIVLDLESGLRPVRGDAVQLQQVLLNLVLNAFEAMKDVPQAEGAVRVRTRQRAGESVQVEVSDRGTGIQPERLAEIFEPFQTTKPEGLGLGLSISRSIVEAHGGRLWVENNPDRGATFCFSVPIESMPSSQRIAERAGAPQSRRP